MKKEWIEPVARWLHSNNPEASCPYDELPKGSDGKNGCQKQALRILNLVERSGLELLIRTDEAKKERQKVAGKMRLLGDWGQLDIKGFPLVTALVEALERGEKP